MGLAPVLETPNIMRSRVSSNTTTGKAPDFLKSVEYVNNDKNTFHSNSMMEEDRRPAHPLRQVIDNIVS